MSQWPHRNTPSADWADSSNDEPIQDLPVAVWSGEFPLFGVTLKCHTLSNGMRIIEADSLEALFSATEQRAPADLEELAAFLKWKRAEQQ